MSQAKETERGSTEPGRGLPWFQQLQRVKHSQHTGAGGRGTGVTAGGGRPVGRAWEFGNHSLVHKEPSEGSVCARRWLRLGKDWCLGYFLT